ncbi:hypothetical protein BB427_03245 [Pseudoalteromonas sp. BMB]|uniref:hypothetical protein n=1 Tax=Pseudoalteromonas sp. BMB TaxID=1874619 RepID=UPI00083CFE87|nr:hypothetical protein [Pseudoalteromonas sp. BMB]ODB35629.1 hypothetical protein BB427_03245 [Pseudoalteromonas sp. BMB]
MRALLLAGLLSLISISSFHSSATVNDNKLNIFKQELSVQEIALRYPCCNDHERYCEPYYTKAQEDISKSVPTEEMLAELNVATLNSPIYIGARYNFGKSNFSPIYTVRYVFNPCFMEEPIRINELTGYEATFKVDGDYGPDLIFDINGRSDKTMNLSVSCGLFSASDSGDEWVISKTENTVKSCQSMKLKYTFPANSGPSAFELNISIREKFY